MHRRMNPAGLALLAVGFAVAIATAASAAPPPDSWITTKTKMSLFTTEGVSGTAIHVDTMNGVVTLHGTVTSDAERKKAESVARGIDGVTNVRNLLQVVAPGHEKTVATNDDQIKTRVQNELRQDPVLKDVSVQSVNAGVVLLSGDVPTMSDHLRAIEDASRVAGVRRVASEIKSPNTLADQEIYSEQNKTGPQKAGSRIGDAWITSAVKTRLLADEQTPALDINVDTTDGHVTLFGLVPTQQAKKAAEDDARKVSGVKMVT